MSSIQETDVQDEAPAKVLRNDAAFHAYPGARAPDRQGRVDVFGVNIATYEWGQADAPPVLLVHGALDFARTFDVFAPLIADAGYRVVSYDHRGHGDSSPAALYGWVADERDLLCVADAVSKQPMPVIGHSKGGSLLIHAIEALPHRFTRFACIDGMPFRSPHPDSAMHERRYMTPEVISKWLDNRHVSPDAERKPGGLQALAARRARLNPRLSEEWLCYLVSKGAYEQPDGWRWKLDPAIRPGGFGVMRSRWMTDRLPGFPVPLLALFSTIDEPMGWDCKLEDLIDYLPASAQAIAMPDTGHFIHIERPRQTADLILDFLRS